MRAVVLRGTGGPEQLVLEDVPEPVAADGQDVVEVKACGINFADVLVRLGLTDVPDDELLGPARSLQDDRSH